MEKYELLIIIAFVSLVCSSEIDEIEPKKRDAGKGTSLNTIQGGGQKQEYTYSIYHNSNPQTSSPNHSYQNQVPNSFYPSQTASQYYTSNPTSDSASTYTRQSQGNQVTPHSSAQFVPINFVPNPGYQSKYNAVQPKSVGNVQYAVVQPSALPTQQISPYPQLPHTLFSPNPASPGHPQVFGPPFVAPNYQQILPGPYLAHPSSLTLLAQPHPSVYSNLLYQNPAQGLYNNYYPSNSQPKYGVTYESSSQQDYEKLPGPVSFTKEENDVGTQNVDYTAQSDVNSNYKNPYTNRHSYTKST